MSNSLFTEVSDAGRIVAEPAVSVLVLSYRHAEYLDACLASIVTQEFDSGYEVIINDDASDDHSAVIALEYQRRYPNLIRVLLGACNIGARESSRRVLGAARADILAWCEGDDYWLLPSKLQKQFDIITQDPRVGGVHADWIEVRRRGRAWVECRERSRHFGLPRARLEGDILQTFFDPLVLRTCTMMLRRQVFLEATKVGLYDKSYPFGDTITAFVLASGWRVGYLPEVAAAYRLAPNSLMRSGATARVALLEAALSFDADARASGLAGDRYPPHYRWEILLGLALWSVRAGHFDGARRHLVDWWRSSSVMQHAVSFIKAIAMRSPRLWIWCYSGRSTG